MPLTLGEKLRQAREAHGISIREIAEQTRISPHYLECIERNDFKTLPGGIFNKGFVKSFARYVGVNEAEAVQDYILALGEPEEADAPRPYHPEVLTDDQTKSSMAPTIVFAVIILALMTAGILFVLRYLQNPSPAANQSVATTPPLTNTAANTSAANANIVTPPAAGDKINVEIRAVSEPVWINYTVDGVAKIQTLAPDEIVKVDATNAFKISYSKAKLPNLQVSVNGQQIKPPTAEGKGKVEFEITKSNLNQFVPRGQPATPETTVAATPGSAGTPGPKRTPEPEKSKTPRPNPTATGSPRPKPSPKPTVIVVGTPTRPRTTPVNRPN